MTHDLLNDWKHLSRIQSQADVESLQYLARPNQQR